MKECTDFLYIDIRKKKTGSQSSTGLTHLEMHSIGGLVGSYRMELGGSSESLHFMK